MSNVIKFEQINLNDIITKNIINLSFDFKSKFIDELNNNFTENEKKWYIANLYMYLNYHKTDDYPINLDNVYKLLGFSNKGNAKSTLVNNFIENEDYKIINASNSENKQVSPCKENFKDTRGGTNYEMIMLNIETFKNLCMIVKTEKSKEIRKYYIKLESIFNKITNEEMLENKKQLEEKKKQLQEKQEEIEKHKYDLEITKKQLEITTKLTVKKWYNHDPGDVIYAIKNKDSKDPKDIKTIKIGKTRNISNRENTYTSLNQTSDIFYIRRCLNCDLAEKVIHHMLNKHRIESNKEWFEINDDLAIYTIDIVCMFLDNFIDDSQYLPKTKIKDDLTNAMKFVKEITNETTNEQSEERNEETTNEQSEEKDALTLHFDKFVKEFCEVGDDKKCLMLDILGAYRIWRKKTEPSTKKNLTTYLQKNYDTSHEYVKEENTRLQYYIGLQPKPFIMKPENDNELPYYEEFILSECKFSYTYMVAKTTLCDEYKVWVSAKYPGYKFTKYEENKMVAYLNRHFMNSKKIHLKGGTNGYYGLQMKDDMYDKTGTCETRRKKVYKKDTVTNQILESYDSLNTAADQIGMDIKKLSNFILTKTKIENYIYSYDL